MKIRDDFRRDGIAAHFLADSSLMVKLANALPGSRINIGYPSICSIEKEVVKSILQNFANLNIEPVLFAHAIQEHLDLNAELIKHYPKASVCFRTPVSERFLNNTLKKTKEQTIAHLVNLIDNFKKKSTNPIDIALADTTSKEEGLIDSVGDFARDLHNAGARSVIICDSLGIGEPEYIDKLFKSIDSKTNGEVEAHFHNDNGKALENIKIAMNYGVQTINTAIYGSSERGTLLDPRALINAEMGIEFDHYKFEEFEKEYEQIFGNPKKNMQQIFGENIIVTGSQYRLRNRPENTIFRFGITSDRFILATMLGIDISCISSEILDAFKTKLFEEKQVVFNASQLKEVANEYNILN